MTIAELAVRISGDMQNFEKSASSVTDKLDAMAKKMASLGASMTLKVTAPLLGIGAASFKSAADLEDAMGATDQIFQNASHSVRMWAADLEGYYGIAESEALGYANMMGSMLQNIGGLTADEAAKQSQTLIELAGDLTAMFGGTTESAVQALTGALKGNNSMLDNYGMAVNETLIKIKAVEMGLIAEGEQLDLAGKQAATLALIMEQTAAAQGQAARESSGASGGMRAFATEVKNLGADLGKVLLPAITPVITKVNEWIQQFAALDDGTKQTIITVLSIVAAVGPVVLILSKMISLGTSLVGVVGGIGRAMTFLATNPIGIAILAITALVAAGVALWKNWDTVKEKLVGVWTVIKDTAVTIWGGIVDAVKAPINAIISGINVLIRGLNRVSFKIPDWVPILGGKSWGFNVPEIPKLAAGGIVTGPTLAMIGERGPEAVVPLDRRVQVDFDYERMAAVFVMALRTYPQAVTNNYNGPGNFRSQRLAMGV